MPGLVLEKIKKGPADGPGTPELHGAGFSQAPGLPPAGFVHPGGSQVIHTRLMLLNRLPLQPK